MQTITDYNTLINKLEKNEEVDFIKLYKIGFTTFMRTAPTTEEVFEQLKIHVHRAHELTPLYLSLLCSAKEFDKIYEFLSKINLSGSEREYDYFNSKCIRYYYWASKETGKLKLGELYTLLATNREFGNLCSILVLQNCLLDYFINFNSELLSEVVSNFTMTREIEAVAEKEEAALFYFYTGYAHLVLGNYRQSLQNLDEADILNRKKSLELNITKCSILCKLLQGELDIKYDYDDELLPYYNLIGTVKRGEIQKLDEILHSNFDEFVSKMKLYFVARRLVANALKEGIRKVANAYSRIRLEDVNGIFGKDVSCLVHRLITEAEINSKVEDGILIKNESSLSQNGGRRINDALKRIIDTREFIKKQMVYPEMPVLNYERLMEEENEMIQKFDI
ncbi:RPN3 [Enterospora canceri]|uniref:RPN3 n=1 Tax=Enterospora canceri TaxID=1081671 RepID=A0A1Y1S5N2_9MICR|nr:RPN3 [Enterospora canceri]